MKKQTKVIIICILIILLMTMGIVSGLYISKIIKNKNFSKTSELTEKSIKTIENLSDIEKEIVGIDTSELEKDEPEETYSVLYKEYLKLSDEEKEKNDIIPRKQEVPFEKLEDIKEIIKEDNEKIPQRFNLAEKIDIKVENQGSHGLCWAFASLNTLETYLALNNLGEYDLSEMHLDYITSDLMYGFRDIHQGGNFGNFQNYIVRSGVVLEEQVPYRYGDYSEEEYNKFIDIAKITEVTETIDFPSMYKYEESTYTEEQIAEFRETVKKHIMKNGGLYASTYGTSAENYYAASSTPEWINHAVTIVGWDDNYSKDNFLSSDGKKPSKDGAYIVLNSWGTFHNNEGYYYISYEDTYIESNLSGIISTSIEDAYKINDIENPVIKEYIIDNFEHHFINYNNEDYITKEVFLNIFTLDLSNRNLTSINGIEIFKNLSNINLSNNNIEDVTPLVELKNLFLIDLSNNNISDISILSNIESKNLYYLNLSNNKIKDVSDLSKIILYGLALDISNNPGITGYEKINNITSLNISDCDIKDISNLSDCKKLVFLKIENTEGITGLNKLPENLGTLDISNCGINSFEELPKSIYSLNISKNNLTTLDGIQNFKYLHNLDISENLIVDWSALKKLSLKDFNDYVEIEENTNSGETFIHVIEDYYEESNISIVANNCNIEDITIFNEIDSLTELHLKDNKITDVSQFNNKNVSFIDLSYNENLTGLQGLNTVITVYLNNCNISDISELLKLDKVSAISLENNKITDISKISELKNLRSISLSGNKGIKGTIINENLYSLNLSDCNLDNNFDFSKFEDWITINISKNPNLTNIYGILNNLKGDSTSLIIDELDFEDFQKLKDKGFYLEMPKVILNYELQNNENKIDFSQNKLLKKAIDKSFNGAISIENGRLLKNECIIEIDDTTKDSVTINFTTYNQVFNYSEIEIIFNPIVAENENAEVNTKNIIDDNTIELDNTEVNGTQTNNIINDIINAEEEI